MKEKHAKDSVKAELQSDVATCVFKNTPSKPIAISVLEDLNNNGKIDTTFIGFPKEPWGVTNNVSPHAFGPPTFEESAIDGASASQVNIKLINP